MTKDEALAGLEHLLKDDVPFKEALAFMRRFRAELTLAERVEVYSPQIAIAMVRRYVRADVRHLFPQFETTARRSVERARIAMR